jgi:hypothetical protein
MTFGIAPFLPIPPPVVQISPSKHSKSHLSIDKGHLQQIPLQDVLAPRPTMHALQIIPLLWFLHLQNNPTLLSPDGLRGRALKPTHRFSIDFQPIYFRLVLLHYCHPPAGLPSTTLLELHRALQHQNYLRQSRGSARNLQRLMWIDCSVPLAKRMLLPCWLSGTIHSRASLSPDHDTLFLKWGVLLRECPPSIHRSL